MLSKAVAGASYSGWGGVLSVQYSRRGIVLGKGGVNRGEVGTSSAGGGGGAYSFVACLSHFTIDRASLSRRSTDLIHNRDTSSIWAIITLLPYTT